MCLVCTHSTLAMDFGLLCEDIKLCSKKEVQLWFEPSRRNSKFRPSSVLTLVSQNTYLAVSTMLHHNLLNHKHMIFSIASQLCFNLPVSLQKSAAYVSVLQMFHLLAAKKKCQTCPIHLRDCYRFIKHSHIRNAMSHSSFSPS